MSDFRYSVTDRITALIMALIILMAGWFSLDYGCRFGDDYAAYLNEGIAIAEGRFREQIHLNYIMHPIDNTLDENSARVYVWGYPLLLAGIYRFAGFDRVNFNSIIWYKIPSLIALAVFAVSFFLFLRRRFSFLLSLVLSVMTSFAGCEFFIFINDLYSDLVFLSFEMLTILIAEIRKDMEKKSLFLSALLGILLWFTYEVRSTGLFIALMIFFIQFMNDVRKKAKKEITFHFFPFLIAALFVFLSERFVFAHASAEISHMDADPATFVLNVKRYGHALAEWLKSFVFSNSEGYESLKLTMIVLLSAILAVFSLGSGKMKNDLVYFFFAVAYFCATCLMSYYQGLRYLYPVFPFIVMFLGYGVQKAAELIRKYTGNHNGWFSGVIAGIISAFMIVNVSLPVFHMDILNMKCDRIRENAEAYSEDAKDIYRYIINNTRKSDVIAFYTSRGLYLNTERLTVPNEILYSKKNVDWYLESDELNYHIPEKYKEYFEEVYKNNSYSFWRRNEQDGEKK